MKKVQNKQINRNPPLTRFWKPSNSVNGSAVKCSPDVVTFRVNRGFKEKRGKKEVCYVPSSEIHISRISIYEFCWNVTTQIIRDVPIQRA
ncbi:hypothetical protein TNCT_334441 [Trichonephila clavata]|uniref:Uncharacterized protein n=1 Tax=Trichonephila clavata TaxID=2740835 RepID=A0A8X6KT09_TRICU|nr:hypothetical protein TNCT_334441 [Trichonephila clavata]